MAVVEGSAAGAMAASWAAVSENAEHSWRAGATLGVGMWRGGQRRAGAL